MKEENILAFIAVVAVLFLAYFCYSSLGNAIDQAFQIGKFGG